MRIIAGPCQHEDFYQSLEIAETCKFICDQYGVDYVFKASYDKANRTHKDSPRGLGMDETLRDFSILKKQIPNLKITTDFHSQKEIEDLSWEFHGDYYDVIDVIQIPAFLSRQTDILDAAAASGKIVNVKKSQMMAPWDVHGILSKLTNAKEVWITERGTSFGYNNLVVDFNGMDHLRTMGDFEFVFDVSHSTQKPGGNWKTSGGRRAGIPALSRAGSALGISNFFVEVHPDPDNALSDGPSSLHLDDFEKFVEDIVKYNYKG